MILSLPRSTGMDGQFYRLPVPRGQLCTGRSIVHVHLPRNNILNASDWPCSSVSGEMVMWCEGLSSSPTLVRNFVVFSCRPISITGANAQINIGKYRTPFHLWWTFLWLTVCLSVCPSDLVTGSLCGWVTKLWLSNYLTNCHSWFWLGGCSKHG